MLHYILKIPWKSPCSFAHVRWMSKPPRKMKQQWNKDHSKEYRQNPGLKRRLEALNLDYDKEELDIDNIDVESFEPDIMTADEQYDDLERYHDKCNRQVMYKMVERKYFQPPKEPNLLTWAEKDQIRYLHEQDPKEWSIERLSESFPATPVIIRKILKSRWLPRDEKRVEKHDAVVEQNWKLLSEGKIPKTPQIQQLVLKAFKDRKPLPALNRPTVQSTDHVAVLATYTKTLENKETFLPDASKPSEFGGILQSYYNRLEERDDVKTLSVSSLPKNYKLKHGQSGSIFHTYDPQGESYLIEEDNDKSNHNITLEKYREKVLKQYSTKKASSPEEHETNFQYQSWLEKQQEKYKKREEQREERLVQGEMIKDIMQDITRKTKIGKNGYEISPKYKESEMLEMKVDRRSGLKNLSVKEPYIYDATVGYQRPLGGAEEYPDHIQIPDSQKKEGRLYKVGDRYYDEDGELLYRVPGMES